MDGVEEEDVPMEEDATGEGVEAAADAQPLTQVKVLKTAATPQWGGGEAHAGEHAGDRNPGTLEGEVDEGMLLGCEILKVFLLGNTHNGFKNLSRLAMMWTVHHQRSWGCTLFI